MADKLIYKGGANVVGQTGDEMQLVLPKKGALHRFPRWWNRKGAVAYVDAAIFKVRLDSGITVRLIVPCSIGARTLEIRHDGYGNFTFPVRGGFERVAVFAESDNVLYREYQFAKISGGSPLTRTINPYPSPARKVEPTPPVVEPTSLIVEPEIKVEKVEAPKPKKKKKKIVVEAPVAEEPTE